LPSIRSAREFSCPIIHRRLRVLTGCHASRRPRPSSQKAEAPIPVSLLARRGPARPPLAGARAVVVAAVDVLRRKRSSSASLDCQHSPHRRPQRSQFPAASSATCSPSHRPAQSTSRLKGSLDVAQGASAVTTASTVRRRCSVAPAHAANPFTLLHPRSPWPLPCALPALANSCTSSYVSLRPKPLPDACR
ncbi:hypothetical protein BU26DRAFT_547707, partial [Trematosphaeria pertusa]